MDNNSSMPLNEPNKGSSSSSILIFLLTLIIAGGIFCIYKNKCQVQSKKSDDSDFKRSSVQSQDSITSNESIENEDT